MKSLFSVFLLGTGLYAGLFSATANFSMEELKPVSSYTLDTAGINPRIYEFIPKNDKTKLCIVIFGNDKSAPAIHCFKKEK